MAATNIAANAAVRLTMRFPFWCELFYSMDIQKASDEQIAAGLLTEATDGRKLWINEDFFGKLSLDDQVKELVHELGHKAYLHPTRMGHRDPSLWNVACDHAINNMMVDNGFVLDSTWLCDRKYKGWLSESIYADLKQQGNPPPPPKGRQDVKAPGTTPEQIENAEQQIKQDVERAVQNAAARGDLPMGMREGTSKAMKASTEPWFNHLHRYMQELMSGGYNWGKLNRRTLRTHGCFSPMHMTEELECVQLLIDTSGSCMSRARQAGFCEHVNAILNECKPKKIYVDYFTTRVHAGEEYEAGTCDIDLVAPTTGGTRFGDLFEHVLDHARNPAVCIVLTDLQSSDGYPDEPPFPVVWADVLGYEPEAPYGETLRVLVDD